MHKLLMISLLILMSCDTHSTKKSSSTDTETERMSMNKANDQELSNRIRQVLNNDATLSSHAKDIKIIIIDGEVTLRGRANNERERMTIIESVAAIPGIKDLNDQLEILSEETFE